MGWTPTSLWHRATIPGLERWEAKAGGEVAASMHSWAFPKNFPGSLTAARLIQRAWKRRKPQWLTTHGGGLVGQAAWSTIAANAVLQARLLIHAFFNLNRVCKTGTPMPLFLTYLIPEAASSFYTLLHVGKDANVISIDLTLVRRK